MTRRDVRAFGALLALALFGAGNTFAGGDRARAAAVAAGTEPPHLLWAKRLVRELTPDRNAYAWSPTYVVWDEDGSGPARNRSVCSSFVSHDLERAYGFGTPELLKRFGTANPQAKDYYAAIVAERGFTRIDRPSDAKPGDIIVVRYPPGRRPTGHVMILDSRLVSRPPSDPIEGGTTQFEAAVIDSSHSFHGKRDTRYAGTGGHGGGVGRGTMRVYARADGRIAGYTWSTRRISKYYDARERELAIGRFAPIFSRAAANPGATGGSDDGGDSSL